MHLLLAVLTTAKAFYMVCLLLNCKNSNASKTLLPGLFDHISPTLKMLHWLPVKYGIDLKILLITYKAIYGLAPAYLSELITLKTVSRYSPAKSSFNRLELRLCVRWVIVVLPWPHHRSGTICPTRFAAHKVFNLSRKG